MMTERAPDPASFGFAPPGDVPIPYMQRTRDYYLALGYGNPYRWAHYADAPFAKLRKPLAKASIALITTAARVPRGSNAPRAGAAYTADLKFYEPWSLPSGDDFDLRINHVAIDFDHTTQADQASFFPLAALRAAAQAGRIGRIAPRVHGAPTNRSHRTTIGSDAPDLVARVRQDGADAAILVPNCPVCHQTMALTSRALEAAGIATVVMGCAKDIVEHAGVARFLFSDFPLGNAAGKPGDPGSQSATLALALDLLETAPAARTTVQSPQRWADDPSWKNDYANAAKLSAAEIAQKRAELDAIRDGARKLREG
jgi:glycine/betaine/sarcosine/D-proline reductase family selenoprotein B